MPNYIPELSGYSGQGQFRYWCQRVLPLVYDDSLSYYELLNKVVSYLNNTIEDVAKAEGNIDSLLTAYTQLQTFVNDYFDNLDVQEQINNKLDEMAENGELSDLLEPFIPDLVTGWLDEHVTPTSPVVDNTLSISGAAADAKVTGTEIAKAIKSYIRLAPNALNNYTSADEFQLNSVIFVNAQITADHIANLPKYSTIAYIITTSYGSSAVSRCQIYISSLLCAVRMCLGSGVWESWNVLANNNDVLKYTSLNLSNYNSLAEIPENTSYVINNNYSDTPQGAGSGIIISMQYSPQYKVQIFLSLVSNKYGLFYRTVNISNNSTSDWRNLYVSDNSLTSSGIYIEHSNLHSITDVNNLETNKIYLIGSDVTDSDVAHLPAIGVLAYILTFTYDTSDTQSALQIYISPSDLYIRRKRLGVWTEWSKKASTSDLNTEINKAVQASYVYIESANLQGYTALSELDNNKIYLIGSDVTSAMLSDIPATGELAYTITLNYDTDSTQTGVQIFVSDTTFAVRRKRLGVYSDWSYKASFNDLLDNNLFKTYTLEPNYGSGSGTCTETEVDYPNIRNKKGYKITISASDAAKFGYRAPYTVKLFNGFTYELSFWAKGTGTLQTILQYYINDYTLTEEWQKYTYRFTATYTETAFLYVYNMTVNSEVEFTDIKLRVITESQLEKDLQYKVIIPVVYNDGSLYPSTGTPLTSQNRTRTFDFLNISDSVDDILTVYLPEGWKMSGREYSTASSSDYIGTMGYRGGWFRGLCKIPIKKDRYYRFLFGKEVPSEEDPSVIVDKNISIADMGNSGIEFSYMCATPKKDVRVLCIGNSHTNQGVQYLRSILHDNGYNAIVGNYFWGGAATTLQKQYGALLHDIREINTGYVYPATGGDVEIHVYCNEGIYIDNTKTLTDLVKAQKWDYVVFQQTTLASCDYDTFFIGNDANPNDNTFTINKFENFLKSSYCINNADLKFGIVAVHSRASTYEGDPMTPAQQYNAIQEVIPEVAFNMDRCDFIVNEGLAINEARKNPYLNTTGTDDELTRDKNHLANGIPTFISSLTYALPIVGNSGVDNAEMPVDTENMKNKYLEYLAKKVALIANDNIKTTPYTPIE